MWKFLVFSVVQQRQSFSQENSPRAFEVRKVFCDNRWEKEIREQTGGEGKIIGMVWYLFELKGECYCVRKRAYYTFFVIMRYMIIKRMWRTLCNESCAVVRTIWRSPWEFPLVHHPPAHIVQQFIQGPGLCHFP